MNERRRTIEMMEITGALQRPRRRERDDLSPAKGIATAFGIAVPIWVLAALLMGLWPFG